LSNLTLRSDPPELRKTDPADTRLTRRVWRSWLSAGILAAALHLTCIGQLCAQPPLQCNANTGVPPIVSAEGASVLVGDLILNCTGGTPTPAGASVPMYDFLIVLNTNITSRVVGSNGLSEVMLMIDEPLPPAAARVPDGTVFVPFGSPPPQVLCMPQGNPCPIVGDGAGTPYETITGTPTVYSGRQSSPTSLKWTVPIDAPGNAITRVIRITNVRANASQLGSASTMIPTQIVMLFAIVGNPGISTNDPHQTVAFIETGLIVGGTSGSGLQCVSQNMPLSGPNFNITAKEGFASSFHRRNVAVTSDGATAPAPLAQNIPGYPLNSETGFYNPVLFPQPPASQPGLADYGTRIRVTFSDIPSGVNILVPLQVSLNDGTNVPSTPQPPPSPVPQGITHGLMVLIQTDQYGVSTGPGYAAVTTIAGMSGGVPVAAITPSATPGQGYAVYEVVNTDVNTTETATIPVSVASTNNAGSGLIKASVSFAPAGGSVANIQTSDATAPIPRFGDNSVPRSVYAVGDCSPGGVTITMVPFDGPVLVDGVMQSTPYATHWTPGSMHTLSVASPIDLGPGQRQAFSNWSDAGAQAHTATTPNAPVLYQASYTLQYKLTPLISPAGTGTVVASPPSPDGFYAASTPVQLTASPAAGFLFSGWVALTKTNPLTVTVNSPVFVQADFEVFQPPSADSVTPSSGSGMSQTFSFAFRDIYGFTDLSTTYMGFSSTLAFGNACYSYYDQNANALWLLNDAANAWLGPATPGAAGTLQNNQCTLDAAGSSVSGSYFYMTVNVALTFKTPFGGAKNVYMCALNNGGLSTNWQQRGTWLVPVPNNQPPTTVSVTPSSGSGSSQTFSLVYSDPNGFTDLSTTYVVINRSFNFPGSCSAYYDRNANALWLLNDAANSWLGPMAPGAASTLQNGQCTLSGAGSSVSGSGNSLTVNIALSFLNGFGGVRNVYMCALDNSALSSGWQQRGSWTVPVPNNQPPAAVSVTPSFGSLSSLTFSFVFSDPNGFTDLSTTYIGFSSTFAFVNACYSYYDRGANELWLLNDAANAWLGPMIPGSAGTLQNTQCALIGTGSSVLGSGNNLTVNVGLTFKVPFAGAKNVYLCALDNSGLSTGWQQRGTWTVPVPNNQPPATVSVAPGGGGPSATFSFVFSDPDGFADLSTAYMGFSATFSFGNACYSYYDQNANTLWLLNDAANGWLGPVTPGAAGTLQNNQCTLNAAGSSLSWLGNNLTVNVALSFKAPFAGAKNVYMCALDNSGASSGWQQLGAWLAQ
jgi:hypothetical protein